MYPNQPPQTPTPPQIPTPSQNPGDYLNQIAPQAPKKSVFTFGIKQLLIIGAALVLLVIILSVVVGALTGGKKEPLERLSARLTATQAIVTAAKPNLKSSELRSLNSNLDLYLTDTNREITAPLLSAGIDIKKLSKNIVASESTADLSTRLEDARLNAVFDRTYAREMAYQLGTLITLMSQTYNSTSNAELKTFLKSAYDNLKPTQESFANFTTGE